MSAVPLLEVRGLSRRFGKFTAVHDLSFRVSPGEIWGFIGPNGAGKTTTMRICATLDLPSQGDVLVDGLSVLADPGHARAKIGFMPDALGTYADTTIEEYLDFYARAAGLRGAEREQRIQSVAEFTELGHLMDRMMNSLSKGMSQRLCLAKTLLHDPKLLILDEPASGLDPRARVEFRELIRALADQGKAVLISSHILSELSETCDGVVVIEGGRLVREGHVATLASDLSQHEMLYLRCLADPDQVEIALAEQAGVLQTRADGDNFIVEFAGDEEQIAALLAALVERGLRPVEFRWHRIDLEELFLSFTEGRLQ
ncbi:MAG: multidrug ABC transporter ATP-binding protein [Planctomycetes bacterium]|nr:multidrug ABC transporter ATP-binding protein [Planctomycetota bacterium]